MQWYVFKNVQREAFIGNGNMTESMRLSTVSSKLFLIYHKRSYYVLRNYTTLTYFNMMNDDFYICLSETKQLKTAISMSYQRPCQNQERNCDDFQHNLPPGEPHTV